MFIKDLTAFKEALKEMQESRGVSSDVIIESIKDGIISAYHKTYDESKEIEVDIDEDFNISIHIVKEVVAKVEDPKREISLEEALNIDPEASIGDEMLIEEYSDEFRRVAVQNAKQIIIQRVREAERKKISDRFSNKVGEVISGKVRRVDDVGNIFINVDDIELMLGHREQIPTDNFRAGDSIKFVVSDVVLTTKFPKIVISRRRADFIEALFKFEVPEIEQGIIEIKSVAREAGHRTKIAVYSDSEAIDVLGACVGARGSRIKGIMNEINGEKVDIIIWSDNSEQYIINAIQPAQVSGIEINEDRKEAILKVKKDQLALAIGKNGQNIRLASKLTVFNISVEGIGV